MASSAVHLSRASNPHVPACLSSGSLQLTSRDGNGWHYNHTFHFIPPSLQHSSSIVKHLFARNPLLSVGEILRISGCGHENQHGMRFSRNGDRKQPQIVYGQNSEVKRSHVPNLHDNIASLVYKNQRIRKRIFIKNTTPSRAFTNSDDLVEVSILTHYPRNNPNASLSRRHAHYTLSLPASVIVTSPTTSNDVNTTPPPSGWPCFCGAITPPACCWTRHSLHLLFTFECSQSAITLQVRQELRCFLCSQTRFPLQGIHVSCFRLWAQKVCALQMRQLALRTPCSQSL